MEDIELLLRRFVSARRYGRPDFVFCIADVHRLSYTQQVRVVELIRAAQARHGVADAASLFVVSGEPRQLILSALSAHEVALPPLEESVLQAACRYAFDAHCGQTLAVRSHINGGGKTHRIMRTVAELQQKDHRVRYTRIPLRESSTQGQLVRSLARRLGRTARPAAVAAAGTAGPAESTTEPAEEGTGAEVAESKAVESKAADPADTAQRDGSQRSRAEAGQEPGQEAGQDSEREPGQASTGATRRAVHLDVGHIVPPSANTALFQLLVVGVLRDSRRCRVFHRDPKDVFYIEIPTRVQ